MRHTHTFNQINFDRIYIDWPHAPHIRSVTAKPLKSIYYNRSANEKSVDVVLTTWYELETFGNAYRLILQ